ncbi:Listeria/Bacterioides repeat-containing protein [Ruminococcus sp. YE71]|nr:Listeria/Bacterioides repeat-containing protein [Ruminococcus sp. YE78]SFW34662.1 Listeria/Bacterioides repeat-containing protein [Ruminococcus sp. YE71]
MNLKDKGMNLKHDYGIHTTKLIGLEKIGDSYVGKYESGNTYHTSDEVLSAKHPDGVSEQMRDGFHADDGAPADRVKRDKLAVAVVAARGLGAESYVVLGDTVYELGKDGSNGLSYVMTSTKNKDYSIRKALTGNYTGDATEGVYFLAIDDENQYHIFYYTYNGTDWKTTDGAYIRSKEDACNICNVDADDDGITIRLKDVKQSWCDPKHIYVLEAAPYFKEFPDNLGSTSISKSQTSGSTVSYGATLSTELELSYKQEITEIISLAKVQMGATFSAALTYEGATSTQKTISCEYEDDNCVNTVMMARTPMLVYEYEILGSDGKSAPFAVQTSGLPQMAGVTVEEYNSFAKDYNASGRSSEKLPIVGDNFKLGVAGDPFTYRTAFPENSSGSVASSGSGLNTTSYYSSTSTTKTISNAHTTENGVDIELGASAFSGLSLLGATCTLTYSASGKTGYSTFHTTELGRSGKAGSQIEDSRYDFNWDVGFWDVNGLPVVGYKLWNIKSPTMTPENFSVVKSSITNHEATLTWDAPVFSHGLNKENTYSRTVPTHVRIYQKQNNNEYDDNYIEVPVKNGKVELTGLERNKVYTYRIVGVDCLAGHESRPSQEITFSTTNAAEKLNVSVTAGKGLTMLATSGPETQSVEKGITPVLYKINKGYTLPADFTNRVINGLTVEYTGGNIKVSGTPTAESTIVIPDMVPTNYSISYILDGGTLQNKVTSYTIESDTITLPTPVKFGYEFVGWTDAAGNTVTEIVSGSTGNVTLTANWKASENIPYTVEYYLQGLDEEYPDTPSEVQNLFGTTGETVAVTPKTITGFNKPSKQTVTIKADGTTVVQFYYTRKQFTLTLKDSAFASIIGDNGNYYYGEPITIKANVANGYTFTGWSYDNATVFSTENPLTIEMPAKNITIYALSEAKGNEYGEAAYNWSDDLSTVTAVKKSLNGGADITETVKTTSKVTKEATCTEKGETTYYAVFTNDAFVSQEKTVADIPATGHTYGEPEWIWDVNNNAFATFTCETCGSERFVKATVTSKTAEPTYVSEGKTVYTATVKVNGQIYTDTKTVTISKLTYTAPTVTYEKGEKSVKLKWTKVEGAQSYAVVTYLNGSWVKLAEGNTDTYTVNNLTACKEYKVAVITKLNGKWFNDVSNAIVVSPKTVTPVYPVVKSVDVDGNAFRLTWDAVDGAEKYCVAYYSAGKWKLLAQMTAKETTYAKTKVPAGTFKVVVGTKFNGEWDISNLNKRAVTVTIK